MSPRPPSHLTAILAASIVAAKSREPDAEQTAAVRRILIDWFGVALAGAREPVAGLVRDEFARPEGPASIIGSALRAAPQDAALINGTTGHALDYDDVQEFMGHPGTVIVPAALAAAEAAGASGERLARAVIAGFDAAFFVGSLVMPAHYDFGFHSTATVCCFGAAAATAVIMDLGERETAFALGLAGTQAAGLKSMFGTMAKPFHAGRAASAGVTAARLAARGMTANPAVLEAPQGFLATQAHQPVPEDWRAPAYGEGLADNQYKFHAACYLTHAMIEALAAIKQRGATAGNVRAVAVHVPPSHLKVCNIAAPATGLETKFSLRHIAALVLSGYDTSALETYTDALAQDPALIALRERVEVHGDHDGDFFSARVAVACRDGRVLSQDYDVSQTPRDRAERDRRLVHKFHRLADPVIGRDKAGALRAGIDALGARPTEGLLQSCRV